MKILIVDDKKENLYLLERMIKKIGHEVVLAENGKQALEKLHSDNIKMIISDILMPIMDGYQLCQAVRSDKKFKDLSFIFYTATYIEKDDEDLALKLGANKFIRKPMKPEKFIKIIKNLLQNMEISQVKPKKDIIIEEKELFKLYSERLVNKLEQKMLTLEKETIKRKKLEKNLKKRAKELTCLYNISKLSEQSDISMEQFFIKTLKYILPAWQFPNVTCAKIIYNGQEFKTENFRETIWKQKVDIKEYGKLVGSLEVNYLKEMPNFDKDPFLKEERSLINSIAEILKRLIERKKTERELQLERDNFLNILNSMEDGVYIVNQNYDIEYVNPILTKEFGHFEGMKCFKYFHDLNEICPWCKNKEVFQGKTVRWEWYSPKNQKTYDLIDTPLKNPDGSISKLEIFRDISEIKKVEQKLKKSEKKYREAYNRAEFYKDIFAHDINNILQIILSGMQVSQLILGNPEKLDNLKINAQIIKEQVIRGAKLVSNVRRLSQLEEDRQSLKKIEIFNVLKNAISIVKKSYKDKSVSIRVDSVGEKLFIKANYFLEDVFENILINAVRHNKNLIIDITVRISREQKKGINYIKMEFLDKGVGVDDVMKKIIFKRGYSREQRIQGMGLGLSLVSGITETYNGKIWVEDRVKGDHSKGSNFVLLIPEVD